MHAPSYEGGRESETARRPISAPPLHCTRRGEREKEGRRHEWKLFSFGGSANRSGSWLARPRLKYYEGASSGGRERGGPPDPEWVEHFARRSGAGRSVRRGRCGWRRRRRPVCASELSRQSVQDYECKRLPSVIIIALYSTTINFGWSSRARQPVRPPACRESEKQLEALPDMHRTDHMSSSSVHRKRSRSGADADRGRVACCMNYPLASAWWM